MDATEQETEKRVFEYLDGLRESGSINMFGAAPYVEEEFGVPRAEARKLVTRWMGTFGERR